MEKKVPFFARYLESQELSEVAGGALHTTKLQDTAVTQKYPSDSDEFVTEKYPSDSDELIDNK